ncbi:hypothetical protein LguiA_033534 [Lonicera macranthoides]
MHSLVHSYGPTKLRFCSVPLGHLLLKTTVPRLSQLSHSPLNLQCQACPSTCAWCLPCDGVIIICKFVAL